MYRLLILCTLVVFVRAQVSECPGTVPNPPTKLEDVWRFDTTGANNSVLFGLYFFPQSSLTQSGGIPFYNGNLYVSDWVNDHVIVFDPSNVPANPNNYTGGNLGGAGPQGMKFDDANPPNFYWAERGAKQITRHTLNNYGGKTVLTNSYRGLAYGAPRDLAIRKGGMVYFVDQEVSPPAPNAPGLYRWIPSSNQVELLSTNFGSPNGLAFSPDQRILYVTDGNNNLIRKFNVNKDGSVTDAGIFASSVQVGTPPVEDIAGPQGIITDSQGNVYVSGQAGELLITPAGTHVYSEATGRPAKDQRTGLTSNFGNGGTSLFGGEITYYTSNQLYVNRIRGCISQNPTTGACTAPTCWGDLLATDGACCSGETCSIVSSQSACSGGTWQGAGSLCTPGRCLSTRGGCCRDNGECDIVGAAEFCNGGTWLGEGVPCSQCEGGCCDGNTCSLVYNGANCDDPKVYLGPGSDCSQGCAKGACCPTDGISSCFESPASLCTPNVFKGYGTTCNSSTLCDGAVTDPQGACCIGNTCYTVTEESACTNAPGGGGTFLGFPSTCEVDTCLGGPIDGTTVSGTGTGNGDGDGGDGTGDGTGDGGNDGGDGDGGQSGSGASRISLW